MEQLADGGVLRCTHLVVVQGWAVWQKRSLVLAGIKWGGRDFGFSLRSHDSDQLPKSQRIPPILIVFSLQ